MSIEVIKGAVSRPQKVCVYGPEGVGKTTFAAKFPKPLFLDLEKGSCAYAVDRVYPETVSEVEAVFDKVAAGGTGYETVVIDSYDALWRMYAAQVAVDKKVKSIEDTAYQSGVKVVADLLGRLLIGRVEKVIAAGVNVVVLAHVEVKKHDDLENGVSYDRFQFRVQRLSAFVLMERMDSVLFANYDTKVIQDPGGKFRGVGGKERVLTTIRTAASDGKSRYALPQKIGMTETVVLQLLGGGKIRLRHAWDEFLEDFSDADIEGFLERSGHLSGGRKWWEVGEEVVRRGLANPDRLKAGVQAYAASKAESDVAA
jgi:GTPase SAR1 family protein